MHWKFENSTEKGFSGRNFHFSTQNTNFQLEIDFETPKLDLWAKNCSFQLKSRFYTKKTAREKDFAKKMFF